MIFEGEAGRIVATLTAERDRARSEVERLRQGIEVMQAHHELRAAEDVVRSRDTSDPKRDAYRMRGLRDALFATKLFALLNPTADEVEMAEQAPRKVGGQ